MVSRIALCVLPVVLCTACTPDGATRDGQPTDEEPAASAAEVEAAMREFARAYEREDIESVLNTFTAGAVAFDPVPPGVFEGREGIRAWASGAFETLDGIEIEVGAVHAETAGRTGWGWAPYVFQGRLENGERVRDEGHFSMVWVRQADGSYRSTLFHASNVPEEND